MADPKAPTGEYHDAMVSVLELIWGEGFMAPGGAALVRRMVQGIDIKDKLILDVGCGLGGGDLILAEEFGARVIGIDLEAPLVERARRRIETAGLGKRIEVRRVDAGPFDFSDRTFDVVYSVGAFTQTEDKAAVFADALRVLKPGGAITSYDWMRTDRPYSDAMLRWFELEGLTYAMETMEAHRQLLEGAGFTDVQVADDGGWYAKEAPRELEQLSGPLRGKMIDLIGPEQAAHFIEDWRALVTVLDAGELVPAFFRGFKPR